MFKLYTKERSTFRFADYGRLMELAKGAKSVLEFGPGISTFALIEAGVEKIVTLEHTDEWLEKAVEQFRDYPQVTVSRYRDEFPVMVEDASLLRGGFDLAFVDSPKGFNKPVRNVVGVRKKHPGYEDCSRLNTCLAALDCAPVVYLHDATRPLERCTLGRLWAMGHSYKIVAPKLARIDRYGKDAAGASLPGAPQPGDSPAGADPRSGGI